MNWNKTEDKMPEHNKYVLVHTPFCDYKHSVAFWNGVDWRSADNTTEVWNVSFWMELPPLPEQQ
jgi:uncharacterized protein (DUF1919 family)